ncbi:MAG: AAA family ATPase [Gammaproteobacteria bacterium]|nr:AAA family ATPase [Gammaproteobacteria bacterium]
MYEVFYGFSEDPFRISPDYRFSYSHKSYLKARNYLEYGLLRREGIVVITGEPGTGKSTVINDLLSEYSSHDLVVAKLVTTQLDLDDLLRMVAYSFGIDATASDKATVLIGLQEMLIHLYESNRRALLIIDEAQHLSTEALEELRLLSNIQQNEQPLLQIFLLGQPALQDLVRSTQLEQLRQRLVTVCHFEPLDINETREYIEHRLTVVGWNGDPTISAEAFELIYRYSTGIPRRINLICSRLLLHGQVEELHAFNEHDVRQVVAELPLEMTVPEAAQPQDISMRAVSQQAGKPSVNHNIQDDTIVRGHRPRSRGADLVRRSSTPSSPTIPSAANTPTKSVAHDRPEPKPWPPHSLRKPHDGVKHKSPVLDNKVSSAPRANPKSENHYPRKTTNTRQRPVEEGRNLPPIHPRMKHAPTRNRYLTRSIVAALIFAAVFGGSYGYLVINPGSVADAVGEIFDSSNPLNNHKDTESNIGTEPATEQTPTYIYAQKETSSDILNSAIEPYTLLPGPEVSLDSPLASEHSSSKDTRAPTSSDPEASLRTIKQRTQDPYRPRSYRIPDEDTDGPETSSTESGKWLSADQRLPSLSSIAPSDKPSKPAQPKHTGPGVESKREPPSINRDLENALRHYTPKVERLNNGSLKITLRKEISFTSQSPYLQQTASKMLDKLAFVLRNYQGFTIQVLASSTDKNSVGNQASLSRLRAQTVANHLIKNGISKSRVKLLGIAAPRTTSRTSTEPDRRIEILLKPSV